MTGRHYDLYGIRVASLDEAKKAVEQALAISLVPRSSDYWGNYFNARSGAETIELKANFNKAEHDWNEASFQDWPVLLYVSDTSRATEIEARLINAIEEISLLRREEFG